VDAEARQRFEAALTVDLRRLLEGVPTTLREQLREDPWVAALWDPDGATFPVEELADLARDRLLHALRGHGAGSP